VKYSFIRVALGLRVYRSKRRESWRISRKRLL